MSETTPGDRVEAFLNKLTPRQKPIITSAGGYGEEAIYLMEEDVRAILRTNRSLAAQLLAYGDRIIEASAEIQRATLRAAAAELREEPRYAEWLLDRADSIGKPALEAPE